MAIDLEALRARIGEEIGIGDWFAVSQDRVDAFADATEDHQWIHQAGPAAAQGPFGGPIVHGFLTLSLLVRLRESIPELVPDPRMVVNYGLDKVRFITPVPVGGRIRARAVLADATPVEGGVQLKQAITIELEGSDRPAAYAESLMRVFA
jgi:acyl dehydratase